ncbi:hypothetical protein [Microvirga calopogonii]|uniref:hypothetical protein n=1 Tax=Microvirga calopogonii TaxID=2078013 RepID=UPI0013B376E0|nr:hypothetical protein [Microvirga calopogonii]
MVNVANKPTERFVLEFGCKQRHVGGLADDRVDEVDLEGITTSEKDRPILPDQNVGWIDVPDQAAGPSDRIERASNVDRRPDEKLPISIREAGLLPLWAPEGRKGSPVPDEWHGKANGLIASLRVEQGGRPDSELPELIAFDLEHSF